MHIQLNTDSNIKGDDALAQRVEDVVMGALDRFSERITWVEVYLSDQNSDQKSGTHAIRCVMEVRITGLSPTSVSHQAETVEDAVAGAANKMERSLKTTIGRQDNRPSGRDLGVLPSEEEEEAVAPNRDA